MPRRVIGMRPVPANETTGLIGVEPAFKVF